MARSDMCPALRRANGKVRDQHHALALLLDLHVVVVLFCREVLLDDGEQLALEFFHAARRQLGAIVGEHQLEALLEVVLALATAEQSEHQAPPNRRRRPVKNPPFWSKEGYGTSSPLRRLAMSRKAAPAATFGPSSSEAGLPTLVDTRIRSSSGTM